MSDTVSSQRSVFATASKSADGMEAEARADSARHDAQSAQQFLVLAHQHSFPVAQTEEGHSQTGRRQHTRNCNNGGFGIAEATPFSKT